MVKAESVVQRHPETPETEGLTKWQKILGILLLLFYLAMIAITIATLPYVATDVTNQAVF